MPTDSDRRLLLAHAHPDDETIGQGVTMAKYAADGARVTLVTCTLGEMGEVLVPELEHLAFGRDGGLGQHRIGELAEAMEALGVNDHRFLGGAGHYHDSGMVWDEATGAATIGPEVPPGAFWLADLTEAADLMVEILREVRPHVLVTYDEHGGYGHPDHVQTHRVTMYAILLAAVPSYRPDLGEPWDVPKVYWGAMSEGRMRDALRRIRASGDTTTFEGMEPDGPLPAFVVADKWLTARIDAPELVAAKMAAMRAHATQITVDGPFFALADEVGQVVWGTEFFRLVKGEPGAVDSETGLESDLFAGLS